SSGDAIRARTAGSGSHNGEPAEIESPATATAIRDMSTQGTVCYLQISSARSAAARDELDDEVALESFRDAEECVDPRWAAATFQQRDRRLRRPAELRELALREAHLDAAFRDPLRDLREEPAAVARDDPLAEPLYRALDLCTGLRRHDKSIATLLCRDAVAH